MANLPAIPEKLDEMYAALLSICPELAQINADATGGISLGSVPAIVAAKGRFTVKENGGETICKFPSGHSAEGQPIGVLSCVILRGNPALQKAWYAAAFTPGQEPQSPDCFSTDGVRPDASARSKQCESCAGCTQNTFGSGKNQDGTPSKGKACADRKFLAVYAQNGVYRFAVPPASLGAFVAYAKQLDARGIHLPTVITAIGFDEADDYKLSFAFGGMLDPKALQAKILPMLSTNETMDAVGMKPASTRPPLALVKAQDDTAADLEKEKKTQEEAEKKAAEKKAAEKKATAEKKVAEKKAADAATLAAVDTTDSTAEVSDADLGDLLGLLD
jgi:hypothetical protein